MIKAGGSEYIVIHQDEVSFFSRCRYYAIDQPFDVNRSDFQLQFALKTITKDIQLPIMITSIQILDRKFLLAKNTTILTLDQIGSVASVGLFLNGGFDNLETERSVTVKMDFSYQRKTAAGTVPESKTYEKAFATKILFLDPSKAKP